MYDPMMGAEMAMADELGLMDSPTHEALLRRVEQVLLVNYEKKIREFQSIVNLII